MRIFLLASLFALVSCASVDNHHNGEQIIEGSFHDLKAEGIKNIVEGNIRRAVPFLYSAARQNPNDAEVMGALGEALFNIGRREKGVEYLRRAIELAPRDTRPRFALGRIYKITGHFAEAIEQYEYILERRPNQRVALGMLGDIYYQQDNYAGCVKYFSLFIEVTKKQSAQYLGEADKKLLSRAQDQKTSCQKSM